MKDAAMIYAEASEKLEAIKDRLRIEHSDERDELRSKYDAKVDEAETVSEADLADLLSEDVAELTVNITYGFEWLYDLGHKGKYDAKAKEWFAENALQTPDDHADFSMEWSPGDDIFTHQPYDYNGGRFPFVPHLYDGWISWTNAYLPEHKVITNGSMVYVLLATATGVAGNKMFLLQRVVRDESAPRVGEYLMIGSDFGLDRVSGSIQDVMKPLAVTDAGIDRRKDAGHHEVNGSRARAFAHWGGYVEINNRDD